MSRLLSACAALAALAAVSCGKSAPKDTGGNTEAKGGGVEVVKVPGNDVPPPTMGKGAEGGAPGGAAGSDPLKLGPEEGKIAIQSPADAKAGAEATAQILVTPGSGFHVNTEFPIKLTLQAPDGVTLAKTELIAGGPSKDKGDADVLEEQKLSLGVKVTAAKSGSYTINGTFKFAVCDKDSCRPKKESIAIQVAAK